MLNQDECLEWQRSFFPEGLEVLEGVPFEGVSLAATVAPSADAGAQPARNIVSTLNFQHVDTGIEAGAFDVRSELFAIADEPREHVAAAVAAAAALMRDSSGALSAQPGTLIPRLADVASLPDEITARHGLFIAPSVWAKGVPQFVDGEHMVLMLQLIMITQEELDYATTYSPLELVDALAKEHVAVTDWRRTLPAD